MNYIEMLWHDIGDINTYKAIGRNQLESLGYKFSKSFINVYKDRKDRRPMLVLYEVIDEDNKQPVGFTYLMYMEKKNGIVLKNPFNHYHKMIEKTSPESRK